MKPEIWGPGLWIFLHTLTLGYPDNPSLEDKKRMMDFINMLGFVLPCEKCQLHFQEHLSKHPIQPALESREKIIKWLNDIHNEVNKSLGKKEYTLTEMMDTFENIYKKDSLNPISLCKENFILKILLGILLVVVICLIYYLVKKMNFSFSNLSNITVQKGGFYRY